MLCMSIQHHDNLTTTRRLHLMEVSRGYRLYCSRSTVSPHLQVKPHIYPGTYGASPQLVLPHKNPLKPNFHGTAVVSLPFDLFSCYRRSRNLQRGIKRTQQGPDPVFQAQELAAGNVPPTPYPLASTGGSDMPPIFAG